MRKLLHKALLMACLGLSACIDPMPLQMTGVTPKLVVSGLLTDRADESLNKVTLTWSEPFDGEAQIVYNRPVQGATVRILDGSGRQLSLLEGDRGVYFLPAYLSGQAGERYTLHIQLPDGRTYESAPELLQAAPPLDQLTYTYKTFTDVVRNGSGDLVEQSRGGFEVAANFQDPEGRADYYRWDAEGVFEYFSFAPDYYLPLATQCWSYVGRINSKAVTADDRLFNGNAYKQPVVVVPADKPTRFLVKVRQYALSEQAHTFWRLFYQQQTSVGSIFDPPPAKIRGNIHGLSNPDEEVIGYFGASGVSEASLLIDRALYAPFPGMPYVIPFIAPPNDCLILYPNSTSIKPPGF